MKNNKHVYELGRELFELIERNAHAPEAEDTHRLPQTLLSAFPDNKEGVEAYSAIKTAVFMAEMLGDEQAHFVQASVHALAEAFIEADDDDRARIGRVLYDKGHVLDGLGNPYKAENAADLDRFGQIIDLLQDRTDALPDRVEATVQRRRHDFGYFVLATSGEEPESVTRGPLALDPRPSVAELAEAFELDEEAQAEAVEHVRGDVSSGKLQGLSDALAANDGPFSIN